MIVEVVGVAGLAAAAAGVASAAFLHPASPLGGPVRRVDGGGLALTFDDGPDPAWTPRVLAALDRLGARASFFVLGEQVERWPALVRDCALAGHRVELHGLRHRAATFQRPRTLATELARVADRVEALTGRRPRWYRPPFGARPWTRGAVRASGLRLVTWSWSCGDWSGGLIAGVGPDAAFPPARGGDIVLLHDGPTRDPAARARTLAAVEHLAAGGLSLIPLGDPP